MMIDESRVFGFVIELLRIDGVGRVLLLPGGCALYRFIDSDQFLVVQLSTNALRADDYVLRCIAGLQ